MSASPKYSVPTVDPEVERKLAEKRRADAKAAAEARRIAREQALARRIAGLRKTATDDGAGVAAQIAAARGSAAAKWLDDGFERASARHRELVQKLASLGTVEALEAARQSMAALAREVTACESRARAEALADRLRRERGEKLGRIASVTGALEATLATVPDAARTRFDAAVARAIDDGLAQAARARDEDRLDAAMAQLDALAAPIERHLATVTAAVAAHERARAAAEERLAQSGGVVAGMTADPVVAAWCDKHLVAMRGHLSDMQVAFDRDDFAGVSGIATTIEADAERAVTEAQARQLQEERRAYIVDGLSRTLTAQGFQVAAPQLLRDGDLESAVVIRASREGGAVWLETMVPVDGPVAYDVEGMERHQELAEGGVIQVCDDTEAMLEQFHRELAALGIDMGELYWDGKAPKRIAAGEKDLPLSGPKATRGAGR